MTSDNPDWHLTAIVDYWDVVAKRYLELFRDEFDGKPHDQAVLRAFANSLPRGGRVLDAGCGPCGHVARRLADQGLDVTGIDVSPICIALSKTEEPGLNFEVMDMAATRFPDGHFDGIIAYYALHYHPRQHLAGIVRELARIIRQGGRLLLVAKEGDGEGWIPDPMGMADKAFWSACTAEDLKALLAANGFSDVICDARAPLAQEIDVRRLYLTARAGL